MVKIRLAQTGSTNRKTYRLIVIEEGKRRNGRAIEVLGHVNPLVKPTEVTIKNDRLEYWVGQGAVISDAVKKLLASKSS